MKIIIKNILLSTINIQTKHVGLSISGITKNNLICMQICFTSKCKNTNYI